MLKLYKRLVKSHLKHRVRVLAPYDRIHIAKLERAAGKIYEVVARTQGPERKRRGCAGNDYS